MVVDLIFTFDSPYSLPLRTTGISFILKPTALAFESISGLISVPEDSSSMESKTSLRYALKIPVTVLMSPVSA